MHRLFSFLLCFTGCSMLADAQDGSQTIGALQGDQLKEISGVTASRTHPGIYYVHNDSGDEPRFFAISKEGALRGEYRFTGDSVHFHRVKDCEDIATGPGPEKGKSYIYLADIGDNAGMRFNIRVYRFEEPALNSAAPQTLPTKALTLRYPDGPKDAETILIDPQDQLIYILSKRKKSVYVYTTPLAFDRDTAVLENVASLQLEGKKKERWLVSGDISKDGQQVLLKTMNAVYYWKRQPGEHLYETLQRKPVPLPYKNKGQEEAICFSHDEKGYLIIAEGQHSPVRYFAFPSSVSGHTTAK